MIFDWFRCPERLPNGPTDDSLLHIEKLTLVPNTRYQGKLWGYRPSSMVKKLIAHQSMSLGDTISVHNYHISPKSHLKAGGAPKIAYHYTIEKDGTVYLVNEQTDVVWHCRRYNIDSIGILILGNFDGEGYVGQNKPTKEQLASLGQLFDHLLGEFNLTKQDVYGHDDFGKRACPGFEIAKYIKKYRG